MSKPSWDDAPEWANALAMNEDGQWRWYERSDLCSISEDGKWYGGGRCRHASYQDVTHWEDTKETRP